MTLDSEFRETLVDELDELLEAYGSNPDPEPIADFLIDQLEMYADEHSIDDILIALEEDGELDAPLREVLETEMASNDEFRFTGEEVVSLLDRLCNIVWDEVGEEEGDDDDDEDDDLD